MKTQAEIEANAADLIRRFEQEARGRGPTEIRAHLLGDILVVRLQGVLTAAEQQLSKSASGRGRDLLKQVRTHLIETQKSLLYAMIEEITGVAVVSMHHDVCTVTGEAVVLFTLATSPIFKAKTK
jgi:uncharacterized protein YbcI